jgi:putative two-component system response regulator
MAVADVYDALICRRVYKHPFSHADAQRFIVEGSGRKFDPLLVQAFTHLAPRFAEIAEALRDRPASDLDGLVI